MRSHFFLSIASSFFALQTGCFPAYTRIRPEIEFRITDKSGAPIKGATAFLTTRADPHSRLIHQQTFNARENGVISIDSKRQWELVTLMIHGSNYYFWPWCVQAPGYQRTDGKIRAGKVSIVGSDKTSEESEPITLILKKISPDSQSECIVL